MNTRAVTLGIAIIILAVLAYYVGTNRAVIDEARVMANSDTAAGQSGKIAASEAYDPALAGTWQSTDDAKFTREFSADGTVTDRYDGDASATMSGTYAKVNPIEDAPLGISAEYLAEMPSVIKINWSDGESAYFGVSAVSTTSLALIHLSGRGNVLSFTKVR